MKQKSLISLITLFIALPALADDHLATVGHWRFDTDDAETGSPITQSENVSNPALCSLVANPATTANVDIPALSE